MGETSLSTEAFYTGVATYMDRLDPTWAQEQWRSQVEKEESALRGILGESLGQSILDCSCGSGAQAIPLAKLGWRVTATDITEAYLSSARERAHEAGVQIDFHACDMRDLGQKFSAAFDWVISCMAIDNITEDGEIKEATDGIFHALRPGGKCYIRLRNFDTIMRERPRYDFREERALPTGRVIRLEDWDYRSESHIVCTYIFLHEDSQRSGYKWATSIFSYLRRALHQEELRCFLEVTGFDPIDFLPQSSQWGYKEVIAVKPR
jgi:ubiquinone/menaquinone biosynthesis C-methylase UbiE